MHGYIDAEPGHVRVEVTGDGDEIMLVVEDDGRGLLPRPDSPGLGLGLGLMATLSERVHTHTKPGGGTCVCMWFSRA